eukprot:scaffold908_cov61-Phaeocystis_antarctica.AAC.1
MAGFGTVSTSSAGGSRDSESETWHLARSFRGELGARHPLTPWKCRSSFGALALWPMCNDAVPIAAMQNCVPPCT